MAGNFRVIIVSDCGTEDADLAQALDVGTLDVCSVASNAECIRLIAGGNFAPDLVLLNPCEPCQDTIGSLRTLHSLYPNLLFAVTGSHLDPGFIVEASHAGAQLFLRKPIFAKDVEGLIARVRIHSPRNEEPALAAGPGVRIEELSNGAFFLAASPVMQQIYAQVKVIARADVPVLITGESGVGKEVISQLIHHHSTRAGRQFLKVNCAALPNDLLESELFGYEAGAFTGAMKSKPGKFEQCQKGTILLDEIGEMSPQMQAKLLHVLQDGEFSRLGARVNTKVDVRVVAATNIDMQKAIADKTFREDLYYRLNAFVIHVPALRERKEEIPYLLQELSRRLAASNRMEPISFSARLISAALAYNWPGNLRELGNFVKRYLIMRDETSALVDLESKMPTRLAVSNGHMVPSLTQPAESGLKSVVRTMKDEKETQIIRDTLEQTGWNRRIAAEKLQISYKALLYKIRQYNLEVSA